MLHFTGFYSSDSDTTFYSQHMRLNLCLHICVCALAAKWLNNELPCGTFTVSAANSALQCELPFLWLGNCSLGFSWWKHIEWIQRGFEAGSESWRNTTQLLEISKEGSDFASSLKLHIDVWLFIKFCCQSFSLFPFDKKRKTEKKHQKNISQQKEERKSVCIDFCFRS